MRTRAGLERLCGPADRELALGVDKDREVAVEPCAEELEAAPDRPLPRERERVREDRREQAIELVAEDVVGGGRDGELPAPLERDRHEDDPVVPVQAVIRREQDRPAKTPQLLGAGHLHLVEGVDERIEERLLEEQPEAPHSGLSGQP